MKQKQLNKIVVKSEYSRRFPDPLNQVINQGPYNVNHYILLTKAIDVPRGIPKDPNPRVVRGTDYGIYKEVRQSLEDEGDPMFHLKNKGITILAQKVDISKDKKTATLYFGENDGIADGAHTYEIILVAQENKTCPDSQYVKFEVITGISREMGVEISGGLNTAVQVQAASLANLEGKFEWVKEVIKDMPYADKIAYKQNEKKPYDIRDILSFLILFDTKHFSSKTHPKIAYTSKAQCLELYEKDQKSLEMLKPILKDILYLSDYVHIKGRERYNEEKGGKAGGQKGVYNKRERGIHKFIFMDTEDRYRLYDGALYPILGAMRFLIEKNSSGTAYSWRLKSFGAVKRFFDEIAPELIASTYKTSITHDRKPNSIGKDENHWGYLYKTAALHYLENYNK